MSSHPTKLFVELCAGTAALSLAHYAKGAPLKSRKGAFKQVKPPVSRMGSKSGYAEAILDVLGLEPGEGQVAGTHYIWCEPDPGCRLLLEAYRDAALAKAAADIIRGWADEDPRALWERLRAEGPPRYPAEAREVARWLFGSAASYSPRFPFDGYLDPEAGGRYGAGRLDVARKTAALPEIEAATILPDAHAADPGPALPPGTVVYIDPPYSDAPPMIPPVLAAQFLPLDACGREEGDAALRASGLDHLREPVAHLRVSVFEVLRSAGVQPEVLDSVVERVVIDVVDDLVWSQFASDVALHDKTVLANAPAVAHEEPVPVLNPALALAGAADSRLGLDLRGELRKFALRCQAQPSAAAKLSQAVAWAGCALSGRRTPWAREGGSADLAGDLERHCLLRVRVRLDTNTNLRLPGRKTTGYANKLPRADVIALARRWADAGATVCISEAEPIPELVADGWEVADITRRRKGQRRTFSKQQSEYLTIKRATP